MGCNGCLGIGTYFNLKEVIFLTKKKEDKNTFDWTKTIQKLNLTETMKAGLIYHIINNNLNPKSKNELNKIVEDYEKLPLGV